MLKLWEQAQTVLLAPMESLAEIDVPNQRHKVKAHLISKVGWVLIDSSQQRRSWTCIDRLNRT
jgi:hypothetical protein